MAESVKEFFDGLQAHINPDKIAGMNVTYQFNISGEGGGTWNVKLADGASSVSEGAADSANITLSATGEDWLNITSGKLNGQMAFMTGKLKIQGDMSLALKLQSIFL